MAPSQKPITVKLNQAEIEALDRFVELAGLNGRSHALRLMAQPYMTATVTAMQTKSSFKAAKKLLSEQLAINKLLDKAAKKEADSGQGEIDLEGPELVVLPAT